MQVMWNLEDLAKYLVQEAERQARGPRRDTRRTGAMRRRARPSRRAGGRQHKLAAAADRSLGAGRTVPSGALSA